jgi:Tfp pilus assembly protein PilF
MPVVGSAPGPWAPPRQIGSGLSPDALGPEPIIPSAHRLVRTEVGRQRSPRAARMLQVETGVHHLAHIGSEGKVAHEQGFDDIPFRVRQVTRIAPPISLVFLAYFSRSWSVHISISFRQSSTVGQKIQSNRLSDLAPKMQRILEIIGEDNHENGSEQFFYGLYYKAIDFFDKSEAAYRRSIELNPKVSAPWNGLGNLLANIPHRHDEAEAAYRRAIELDPKASAPWSDLGNLLADSLCRHDEAEAADHRAIELDPQAFSPWNGLGTLLAEFLHRHDEAEAAYRRAIDLDPKASAPWHNLGCLLADCSATIWMRSERQSG